MGREDVLCRVRTKDFYDVSYCRGVIDWLHNVKKIPYEKMRPRDIRRIANLSKKRSAAILREQGIRIF